MALSWRGLFVMGLLVAAWMGCSGSSSKTENPPKPAANAGRAGAGHGGKGGAGGTMGEAGAAGSEGGRAVTPGSSGSAPRAGRGGGGGMFGSGAFAGSPVSTGGTSLGGVSGTSVTGGSAGMAATGNAGGQAPNAWGCPRSTWHDGKCDCGCEIMDPDCSEQSIDQCEVCNDNGSCNHAECPGRIDPADITHCLPAPEGWTCTPWAYGDGTTCDCGCGIADPDCANEKGSSCERCDAVGTCANGPCPSSIDADDNTRCFIPSSWDCDLSRYGDGRCDCGCTEVDVDCPDSKASSCEACTGCTWQDCSVIDEDENGYCTVPPGGWTCNPRLYRDGTQCDCGCGWPDPDCKSTHSVDCDTCNASGSCSGQKCPGLIDSDHSHQCIHPDPPAGWTCSPYQYGDFYYCDCGCGLPDPDCRDSAIGSCELCCGLSYCPGEVDPDDTTQCVRPSGWNCTIQEYSDGVCDCGCGVVDPACGSASRVYCSNYPVDGCSGGHQDHVNASNNAVCTVNVPSEWTCDRNYYGDGFCDCGCGAVDVDCPTKKASDCRQCNDQGSCSSATCPGSILTNDNAHCSN